MAAFVLVDDARALPGQALAFEDAAEWIVCTDPASVADALGALQAGLERGLYAAGYMAYELGYVLEPKLAPLLPPLRDTPLLALGLWRAPRPLVGEAIGAWLATVGGDGSYAVGPARVGWTRAVYGDAFARAKDYIAAGDAYQVNLTFPLGFAFTGEPAAFYRDLRRKARAGHGALMVRDSEAIVSLSPELFLAIDGDAIRTRPMKGTAARAPGVAEDRDAARALSADAKQRAENLMIVDLLRNDLGRLAETGSVRVDDLFSVETYPTLHTMTSGISARPRRGTGVADLVRAMFPCGSVTGAPKLRAMEIIRELEPTPRGVYCGAVGWLGPNGNGAFNVAIRTLEIRNGRARMGVGSGVVADSEVAREYDECLLKARFVTAREEGFGLIETILWRADKGYWLIERHLARLEASAAYFLFACDLTKVRAALDVEAERLAAAACRGRHRVRLVLEASGKLALASEPLAASEAEDRPLGLVISARRTASDDPHYRHKTTLRTLYDDEFVKATRRRGCDEVIFLNERGEVTEASRANIFVVKNGVFATPPLACGVLDGCLRAALIARADPPIVEHVLFPADLAAADEIHLGNSVRGLRRAVLLG